MKFFALLAMASVAFAGVTNNNELPRNIFDKRSCSGNNCNRAITGTAKSLPSSTLRKSDCSSFLLTTVTPSPVVKTKWIGDNSFYYETAITTAVTVIPTSKPSYASACSSSGAYASACKCYGITGKTTTAPRPTVTVTKVQGC
ncbi:hypothetical protein F503_00474 [Ophiostoma piceae UAMH 11346]|uniref:Uncharacterized protein n=1 Tax=Ophiostoma piceae (strain UAMH 11346) TaxID=1262450 RepID=S3C4N7_OPHP1|nr:hypothetical protein F503_00474 [Ophiostoma piceae UAMH 11346]